MHAQVAVRNDRVHFNRAVLPWLRSLRGAALRLSRCSADADDLVQETVLKAWRFWSGYQERESCRAWLHRILTNTFVSQRRRHARERDMLACVHVEQPWSAPPSAAGNWQPAIVRDSLDDELRAALHALPEEQRAVLELVDVQERSYREAAERLACPIGTVMSRLHRGRRALKASASTLRPASRVPVARPRLGDVLPRLRAPVAVCDHA